MNIKQLSAAIGVALFASAANAAPSTPTIIWEPQEYSFVEVDLEGTGSYKSLVNRVDEVTISIEWNAWSGDGGDSYKVYFDDMGEAQGTGIRYYIGYRPSGGGAFQPIPQATKGVAGADHLTFRGFTDGDGSSSGGGGPTDGDGNPIYDARIGAGPITVFEGEKTIVRLAFEIGNPGYFGDGYNSYNEPERPKESFWWERIDDNGNVLEVYQTRSTVNTEYPADWDKSSKPRCCRIPHEAYRHHHHPA